MVVISTIGGAGGIGKTWLALNWAHRNLHRFPDGQLFADLHGFSPTGQPARPIDVLGGFLDALGVDRDHQPADSDRRAELYRSLVADKQMLIVLDNAATASQITSLLPAGPHCTVLITSRNHLHGLIARHGARPIHLDVFTTVEAHALLTSALGPNLTIKQAQPIAELIALCSGFPLALGLIAARAACDRHLPLQDTVAELHILGLNALDSTDPTASLPAVLSWSLHHLTEQQRQMFALLGIAPGPDTGLPAAASLNALSERDAHAVLRALADASLIERTPGGRYALHDLVRVYATTVADNLALDLREKALRRIVDFYTHTANAADRLLNPNTSHPQLNPPSSGIHPHPLHDTQASWDWLDTEHACLLAAQHTAITLAWYRTVWQLAWSLHSYHYWRKDHHDQLAMWQAAVDATTHLPEDPAARVIAHLFIGHAHAYLDHHEDAVDHLLQALTLAKHHHDALHQAHTHRALARAWELRRDHRRAFDHARHALDLYRTLDLSVEEARALNAVGWYAAHLGDYDTALNQCQAALILHRDHHNLTGEADTLDSLGYIHHHSGHHIEAIEHYDNALMLYRNHGNIYDAAYILDALGHPHAALGQFVRARAVWQEAFTLYQEQGRQDDATRVQHQLDNLDSHSENV
jgi:tetratricopeptide (TPR) repeat protein